MNITNNKEIRVFGIKRSGNHAIINWLFYQIPGIVVFLNNCYPAGQKTNLYTRIGQINCKGINYWNFKSKFFFFEPNPFKNQFVVEYSREDKRFNREKLKQFPKEALILSFEDRDIVLVNEMIEKAHDDLLGKSREIFNVIILRDAFNLLASYYKKWGQKKGKMQKIVLTWKQYAKLFLEYEKRDDHYFLGINYNKWTVETHYRQNLTEQLQIPFDDSAKNIVASFGGGSSFDQLSYQGDAEKMDIFNRWKAFEKDENFRQLFQDQEIIELSQEIFGIISGTEAFLS